MLLKKGGMTMAVGERLAELLKVKNKKPGTLAGETGIKKNTIYSILKRDNKSVDFSALEKIASALDVPVSYFFPAASAPEERPLPSNVAPIKIVKVPLLGPIAAGEPILAAEEYGTYVEADEDMACSFALRVAGESMEPTVRRGDLVFILRQDDVRDGEIAAVLIDDEATLKRVIHIPNGVTLISDNAAKYPPMTFTYPEHEVIRILGKAVAFKRML